MAAVKGQPSVKPSDLKGPVPEVESFSTLDSFAESFDKLDSFAAKPQEPAGPTGDIRIDYAQPRPGGLADRRPNTEEALADLPSVGGFVGGMVGGIPGAAVGGAAGQSLRRLIEVNMLDKPVDSAGNEALGVIGKGALEGGAQAAGTALAKGVGFLGSKLSGAGESAVDYVKNHFRSQYDSIVEPVMKFIADKGTALNAEASGNEVKRLFSENINNRYGKFINAYSDLDTVAKSVPVNDAVRYKFTQDLKAKALDSLGGDDLKIVRKFSDMIDAAGNGAQIDNIVKQINDAQRSAYQTGATNRSKLLKDLADKVDDFLEGETTKLAGRIQAGKASAQEMGFLQQLTQSRGMQEADPTKYAKALAKDYVNGKNAVREEYRVFRSFLEDVGEQARVKTTGRGPMRFLSDLNDIPSEKLVERMFDPKNAAALRKMQEKTPEVFDQVVRARMKQIVQKSSPNGELDLKSFRKELNKIPESTRQFLAKGEELGLINRTLSNPRLEKLEQMSERTTKYLANSLSAMEELAQVGKGLVKKAPKALEVGAKQAVGKPIAGPLVNGFVPAAPPPEESAP